MNFLLDSHLLIWAANGSRELPQSAADIIADRSNTLWVSVASLWELAIKGSKYQADIRFDARALRVGLLANGYQELRIESDHVLRVRDLPRHHGDPFDRLLVAQAMAEGMVLLTADRVLSAYGDCVRVV